MLGRRIETSSRFGVVWMIGCGFLILRFGLREAVDERKFRPEAHNMRYAQAVSQIRLQTWHLII